MLRQEPELNLLMAKRHLKSLFGNHLFREVDEFFFPKKLPPLKLESKPEPVKDIWGFYNNWKAGPLGSTGILRFARHRRRLAVTLVAQDGELRPHRPKSDG